MKHIAIIIYLSTLISNANLSFANCNLSRPTNVQITTSSCTAIMTWNPVPGASYYMVRYKSIHETQWIPINAQFSTPSYTFTNLIADSAYKFVVAAFCTYGGHSRFGAL